MSAMHRAWLVAVATLAVAACATNSAGSGNGDGASGGSAVPGGAPAPVAGAPAPSAPAPAANPSAGSASPESTSGSASTRAGGGARSAGSAVPPAAETSDERRAAIDRRLNDSLGTFDSHLRREQEQVARERDEHAATGAGTAHSEGEDPEGEATDESGSAGTEGLPDADAEVTDEDGKRPGDLRSSSERKTGSSAGSASPNGAGATEIPDGSDDDIVARRLRRAAEQETDPELKEKLWKEYIEYKKNTSKSGK